MLLLLSACVVWMGGEGDPEAPPCEAPETWSYDADGDGWGDARLEIRSCAEEAGLVRQGGDCDDLDPAIHPDAGEICDNGVDDDCDPGDGGDEVLVDCDDPDCASDPACGGDTGGADTGGVHTGGHTGTGGTIPTGSGEIHVDPLVVNLGGAVAPWFQVSHVATIENRSDEPLTLDEIVVVDDANPAPYGLTWFLYTYSLPFPHEVPARGTFNFYVFCDVTTDTPRNVPDTAYVDIVTSDADEPTTRMTVTCRRG